MNRNASQIPSYILIPAGGIAGTLFCSYFYFLEEVPFTKTKRKRIIAISPEWERKLGEQECTALLQKYRKDILPANHRASATVNRVGQRIANAADQLAREQKQLLKHPPEQACGYASNFSYTVVRSDMANAFVLPNNHVFVLTGLFRYVRDEDELAAVLGHEMGHVMVRHAGERISNSMMKNIIARVLFLFDPTGFISSVFLPVTTLLYDLPHSRSHEIEADYIGIQLAARACYDPRAAKRVFLAMKNGDEGKKNTDKSQSRSPSSPPSNEFISTHPSYDTRLSNFEEWMPEALSKLEGDGGMKCERVRNEMKKARRKAAQDATKRENVYSSQDV